MLLSDIFFIFVWEKGLYLIFVVTYFTRNWCGKYLGHDGQFLFINFYNFLFPVFPGNYKRYQESDAAKIFKMSSNRRCQTRFLVLQ